MAWVLTRESALAFARDWIDAWNSHDLDRILAHYSEDFEMRSPLIQERMNEPTGVLKGKDRVRPYWAIGLQAQPPIQFELQSVYVGASSIAIAYFSVGRGMRTEVVIFDETGKVVSGKCAARRKSSRECRPTSRCSGPGRIDCSAAGGWCCA